MKTVGLVGLGKMGSNMRLRLRKHGIKVVGYDPGVASSDADSLEDMIAQLGEGRRIVWVMVPSGDITRKTIKDLAQILGENPRDGDVVVDGGNSRYTEAQVHAEILNDRGIGFVDCGVSGGIWGLEFGYGLMAGGSKADIKRLMFVFDALRPRGPRKEGFSHSGPVGAGHLAKMAHNGIEYGIMQAYAEGYELLVASDLIVDPHATLQGWMRGTVVRSWILDLLVKALGEDPGLASIAGYVEDSGEARWMVETAIELRVPLHVITAALFARFTSRQKMSPAMKAVAVVRYMFGGHKTTKA